MKNLKLIETELYHKLMRVQGMTNLVVDIDQVLDVKSDPDVWVIYNSEDDFDKYYSLHNLLFDISFDPYRVSKTYEL